MATTNVRLNWEEPVEREPEGLQDGGMAVLSCSNCRKDLVEIRITRPHEPEEYRLKAQCCYCGDTSFEKIVRGGFHYKGAGKPHPDNEDLDIAETLVEDVDIDDKYFLFLTRKVTK